MGRDKNEVSSMKRAPTQNQQQKASWSGDGTYYSINLTKEEKEDFKAYPSKYENNQADTLAKALEAGYKLGMRWNRKLGCFQCTLTALEEAEFNAGSTIGAYHIDPTRALAILIYAIHNKFSVDSPWGPAQQTFSNEW